MNVELVNSDLLEKISRSVWDVYDDNNVVDLVNDALKSGVSPLYLVQKISTALKKVGDLYENNDYFLGDMILCGDRAKQGIDVFRSVLADQRDRIAGTIVFGTVKGDIHDIGKTITSAFLIGYGFLIYDLGVEVTAEMFCDAVKVHAPDILAMSTLLTTCRDQMRVVVEELKKRELRGSVKVIIGGRATDKQFVDEIGADAYASLPQDAITECKKLMKRP